MKYVVPTVPYITIINKNKDTYIIDYVYEFNTVTLKDNSTLIILQTPFSDTQLDDILNYSDTYTLQCKFQPKDIRCNDLESKLKQINNMKLLRKYERYTYEMTEENVYIFYNGNKNIDTTIETILFNKKKEQLKKEIKQELLKELIK